MKKFIALLLSAVMVLSMTACSNSNSDTTTAAQSSTTKATESNETTAETTAAPETEPIVEYPDYVTEPIEIEIWHASGAGANGDYMTKAVQEFNSSNKYGITVVETYAGSYGDVLAKTSTALVAGETPEIVVISSTQIPVLGDQEVLADMSAYAERDGVDMDNFVPGTTAYCYNFDGELVTIPFNRSSAVFYYNKTMWDELGLEPPTSLEDLEVKAAYITEQTGVYGFGCCIDAFFYQQAWVRSLGAEGLINKDGVTAGALENGEFTTMISDWLSWIQAGWCRISAVTSSTSEMKEALIAGEVASMVYSCGGLRDLLTYSAEAGFELGVSLMPVYGGYGSCAGGGNVAIVGRDKTQQEIAAAWEFIKFLSSDEQVAERAAATGYLPVTYSSTETEIIQTLWAVTPQYQVAFEQLKYCDDNNWSVHQSEWVSYTKAAMSYVIQDFSMTPEQATDYLKQQAEIVFPNGSGK